MKNRLLCALLVFLLLIQPNAGATIASADPADTWTDIGDGGDFQNVCGVTVDSKGTVYATDCGTGKVKMLQNGIWIEITGSETFAEPYGIAADSKGNMVVANGYGGNLKTYVNGSWSLVDTGEEGFPMAVAFDSNDNLYVVFIDDDFGNGSVKRLVGGEWEDITEGTPFIDPGGIFVDHNDDVYVTSYLYDASSSQIKKWSNGVWSNVPAVSYCPADTAVNSNNEIYMLDIYTGGNCDDYIGVMKQSEDAWTEFYQLSSADDHLMYNDLFIDKYDNIYVVSYTSHIHKLLVTPPEVLGVSISPASGNVVQGDSLQLEAIVDAIGFADESVTWSSSDGSITVDASGYVTVAADAELGDYTITATSVFDGTKKGTAAITVVEPPDTTAPVISLTSASDTTHNSTTLNFTSDEVGTYSFVVYEATAPAPDALTIEAQGAAVAKGTGSAIAGANTASVTSGLAPSTEYKAYLIVKDAAGNLSDVAAISFETEDPPSSEISPVTATFDKYSKSDGYDDITVTVTLNGNILEGVSNAGTPLYYSSDFVMTGNQLKIKKEYLENLETDKVTLTLMFSAGEPQTLTITIIDSTPPAAPVLQSAEAGDAQVALTWSPVSDATGYAIYSGTASGTYGTDPAATVAAPADGHTVTGLANGTTYYFVVKAVRSGIESDASNEESATPMTVPAAPTDVSAVAGDGEATVSFTAPTDNGGSAIIEYEVIASPGGKSAKGASSPITVTGLTNGTSYTFTVKAINEAGSSAASAASNAVTPTAPDDGGGGGGGDNPPDDNDDSNPPDDNDDSNNPPDDNDDSNPPDDSDDTNPPGDNNDSNPPDDNDDSNPPGDNDDSNPPDDNDDSNPPGDNGGSNPPDDNDDSNPPDDNDDSNNPPDDNDDSNPPDDTPSVPSTPVAPDNGDTSGVPILLNGKSENAGTVVETTRNDQTVTTIVIDAGKLNAMLAEASEKAVITIAVNSASDVIVGELNGQLVKNMEDRQAVLEIQSDRATYTLPAQQVNINAISGQIGDSVSLEDIKIHVEIAAPAEDMVRIIENAAEQGSFALVVPPVEFSVKAVYGDTTFEVTQFTAYVERTIAIPDGIDPDKITTGVVVEPDGTVRHVPTRVMVIDGKYHAVINSLTNSAYSVVWHPLEFSDAASHWAKDAINDMGSRMVINGTEAGLFTPDRDITRAEFAAIIVRGLGLGTASDSPIFTDVDATDWYGDAVHTAHVYGLINGFADGAFRPHDKITREQAMAILARAMELTGLKDQLTAQSADITLQPFEDALTVSGWAMSGIADTVQAGIISGKNGNRLDPQANMTRAEVAAAIQRLLKRSGLI